MENDRTPPEKRLPAIAHEYDSASHELRPNPPRLVRYLVQIAHGEIPGISPPSTEPATLWQNYWPIFGGAGMALLSLFQEMGSHEVTIATGAAYFLISAVGISLAIYAVALASTIIFFALRFSFRHYGWVILGIILLAVLLVR